jgi:hypothetical protein
VVAQTDPGEDEFEAMARGGVGAYRWLISWPALQPRARAEPDWEQTDRIVANLAQNRITPLPFVSGSPCFAVDCAREPPRRAHRQPPVDSARGRLAWARFLSQLVDRYGIGGRFWSANPSLPETPITSWQIWNEQNAPRNFAPAPSVARYAELLGIAARAIRSRDPEARIVLGGMYGDPGGHGAIKARAFLDELYRRPGAADAFDVVALHPYAPSVPGIARQVRQAREVIDSHGDSATPVSVTELGWGVTKRGLGRQTETLRGQARMLTDSFGLLLDRAREWKLDAILWYAWRDTPPGQPVCDWCATAGLFDEAGDARPAWPAYTELSGGEAVGLGGEAVGLGDEGDGGVPAAVLLLAGGAALAVLATWLLFRRIGSR